MAKPMNLDERDPEDRFPLSLILKVKQVKALRDLIMAYDPLLSTNNAIIKMIERHVSEHWIPGYERLDKEKKKGYKESAETIKEVN